MSRSAPPPFLFPFLLLCLLGMFAAVLHGFQETPAPAKAPGGPAPDSPAPAGADGAGMTEQQTDALAELMRKLQEDPQDAETLTAIGEFFFTAGDWPRADGFLSRAIEAAPDGIRPRYMLGISLYRQNRAAEAAKVFEELLAIRQDDAARYNLALLYKHQLGREAEARALFRAIVDSGDAGGDIVEKAKKELERGNKE